MATNKFYTSAGVSPTNKSSETPTNNSFYVAAGVSPVYVEESVESVENAAKYFFLNNSEDQI